MSYAEQLLFARLEPQGEWVREALCARDDNPDRWFPASGMNQYSEALAETKAICRRCPVKNPCLEWALKSKEPHGIFGGATPYERESLLRGVR